MNRKDFRPRESDEQYSSKNLLIPNREETFRVKVYDAKGKYWKTIRVTKKDYKIYTTRKAYKNLRFEKI